MHFTEITYLAAFLTGLLGSVHCIGMCGGIVGALTLQLPKVNHQQTLFQLLPWLLNYNAGRLFSYAVAGALAGWFGGQFRAVLPQPHILGMIFAGGFMMLLGLYLAGWWPGLVHLERFGGLLWKRLEPVGRIFLPVRHPMQALGLGLIWGWLPCGLVYTALVMAIVSSDPLRGALLMLAFGIGTLPMLLSLGTAASSLREITRNPTVRKTVGLIILLLGAYTLFGPLYYQQTGLQVPGLCVAPTL
ncbi:sulfite exporter TauE/SafE family protein [Candidatus Venteria ishoeyi]|uniref:Urease accessory protein UreH-like transmembrane domain-containing protein n=1 Tax=Candidatus Venteria ishoeyi TaxID=1899563 RepID=A0A1H6FEV5_9GAMM|nr:sulfite exporter TauE/SafE family protein [Candidatus Venteria ishoeyi]MDM8546714.1 sulfite exporter TauE/SafE family protein [Candidatus Venteria ishoeyi]SEH08600.1 Uncharacterised protein [Candidatus Venteria ishoeyi]